MSSKKKRKQRQAVKKSVQTSDLKLKNSIPAKYRPAAAAVIAAIVVFLAVLPFEECTAVFRLIFAVAAGLTAGCTVIISENTDKIEKKFPYAYIVMSGGLSLLCLMTIFAFIGVYPFGSDSVVTLDMTHQYIPFYASLRRMLFSGESLEYSWNLGMGGNYWALVGYYLCSPSVLLTLLCPKESLPDLMAVIELVKISLAGCSFAYFYSRKFGRNDITVPIVSLCYSMMSFAVIHMCTVIWTDCIILLPLIVLGLENIVKERTPWLYIGCLTVAMISNYYISYMLCIYLVLYYAAAIVAEREKIAAKEFAVNFLKFVFSSLISVGMSAFVLLPSVFALQNAASAGDEAAKGFLSFNPLKLLAQFMYNSSFDILEENSMPLVYCSIFALLLLPMFFACKAVPAKLKITFGGLSAILILSLFINRLNFIWHGMHIPNNLPHRFSFLICFTMLILSGYVLKNLHDISANIFTFSLIGLMAVNLGVYFLDDAGSLPMFAGTLIFAVIYIVIFVLWKEDKLNLSISSAIVLTVLFAELTSNGVLAVNNLSSESSYNDREAYISSYQSNADAVEQIYASDSDIYRVETISHSTVNDSIMLGYSGLSYFSSTVNGELMNMLKCTGYNADRRTIYYYKSFTPLMDSVLNLKYVFYGEDVGTPPYLEKVGEVSGRFIYRNTLALPRAFAVSENLTQWDIEQKNPFDVQNDFAKKALDMDENVYHVKKLKLDKNMTHGAKLEDGVCTMSDMGGMLSTSFTASKREHIYGYFNCINAMSVSISVGKNNYTLSDDDVYVVDLGYCEKGDKVQISVISNERVEGYITVASLDEDVLEHSINQLNESSAESIKEGDSEFSCEISVEEKQMLFTSIPFESAWTVYVNGKKVKTAAIGGGLIGIPLNEGKNVITMEYSVPGLTAGIIVSVGAFLILIILILYQKRKIKPRRD